MYAVGTNQILGTAAVTIAGNSKVVGEYTTWFPDVPFEDIERIVAVSENDLTGITISGSEDNGTLLFMPAAGAEGFEPPPVDNIVETLIANGSFNTLVAAIQAAELEDDLSGSGPFTVFAPTDDAFDLLPEGTLDSLLEPANKDTLIDLLTYHVFNGSVLASDAIALDGQSVAMLNGKAMSIDLETDDLVLNLGGIRPATVILTDVLCSNGVIHGIDAVLDPGDAGEGDAVE